MLVTSFEQGQSDLRCPNWGNGLRQGDLRHSAGPFSERPLDSIHFRSW